VRLRGLAWSLTIIMFIRSRKTSVFAKARNDALITTPEIDTSFLAAFDHAYKLRGHQRKHGKYTIAIDVSSMTRRLMAVVLSALYSRLIDFTSSANYSCMLLANTCRPDQRHFLYWTSRPLLAAKAGQASGSSAKRCPLARLRSRSGKLAQWNISIKVA